MGRERRNHSHFMFPPFHSVNLAKATSAASAWKKMSTLTPALASVVNVAQKCYDHYKKSVELPSDLLLQ